MRYNIAALALALMFGARPEDTAFTYTPKSGAAKELCPVCKGTKWVGGQKCPKCNDED